MQRHQKFLILIHRIIENLGILEISIGKSIYIWTYFKYKKFSESRELLKQLRYCIDNASNNTDISKLVILDVGAHIGFFTSYAINYSNKVKVLAMEPEGKNTSLFEIVNGKSMYQNNVTLFKMAAWKFNGLIPFHFEKNNSANNMFSINSKFTIPAITIDSLVETYETSLFLVKIDVQGYELEVLQGALKTLSILNPLLIIEIDENALKYRNSSGVELVNFLEVNGYKPWNIETDKFFEKNELNIQKKCIDLLFKYSK